MNCRLVGMYRVAKILTYLLLIVALEGRVHRQYHQSPEEEMPSAPAMPLTEQEAKVKKINPHNRQFSLRIRVLEGEYEGTKRTFIFQAFPDLPYSDLLQLHRDFYFWAYTCLHKESTGCYKHSPAYVSAI